MPLVTHAEALALSFRAASIFERRQWLEGVAVAAHEGDEERLATLCRTWMQAFSPGDAGAFERRLEWDALDLDALRAVVADPQRLEALAPAPWTSWLSEVLARASAVAGAVVAEIDGTPDAYRLDERSLFPDDEAPPFVELLAPWSRAAVDRLAATNPRWALLSASVRRTFTAQLLRELSGVGELAFLDRFGQWRRTHPSSGYRAFVLEMLRGGMVGSWQTLPVLARHLATVADTWTTATGEWLDRLERDRPALEQAFSAGAPLGDVRDVVCGLSDPHNGRRRVMLVSFASGPTVVYKPRDVGTEEAFASFIAWANREGLEPQQRAMRVVARDDYGWSEYADASAFGSSAHVEAYYRQAGGLLALAYLLRARDLQMENIIATADGPVLIDAEMVMQPIADTDVDEAGKTKPESCLASGLLTLSHVGPGDLVYDIGGLSGDGITPTSLSRRVWRDLGEDTIHFKDERVITQPTKNRVLLDGELQRPGSYGEALLDGFTSTYRWLVAHRDALLDARGPLAPFASASARVIFRPSQHYGAVQYQLASPKYQGSGVTRSCALDTLNRVFSRDLVRPPMWPIVADERLSLDALDIPRYWVRTTETAVVGHHGPVASAYFARAGFDAVAMHVAALSDEDLERQRGLILDTLANGVGQRLQAPLPSPDGRPAPDDLLLAHATAIAQELVAHAVGDGAGLHWRAQTTRSTPWERHALYDGSVGTAVFFAGLHGVTGEAAWKDAALGALSDVRALIAGDAGARPADLGACSGLGSIVYGLVVAGGLLGDATLLDDAAAVAARLTTVQIGEDRSYDVTSGAAGAILGLLALHHHRPDRTWLTLAQACGDHLVASQTPMPAGGGWIVRKGRPMAGFAHGCAGIATALLRLAAATGEERYVAGAERALAYERGLFAPELGNWPVIGSLDARTGSGFSVMTAWCHGAPGIALARTIVRDVLHDAACGPEIDVALKTTIASSLGALDHACCGNMGRSHVLVTVGRRLGRPDVVAAGVDVATRTAERASRRQLYGLRGSGVDYRVFDPGFFRGLSGIGYSLLHAARPERLPSVLAFEAVGPVPSEGTLS
ncbi:MAG: type 2 lanthipeptide synthetase LanM family protein [Vicinamibacterales bacterium]